MSALGSARIAALNDALRSRVGVPIFLDPNEPQLGSILMTSGIMALAPAAIIEIWAAVRGFDPFTPANDPYGEHDFGSIDIDGVGKVFWKIDYYADETFTSGSEDPSDPARCFRLLTIMLAEEY